jgi:NSS family neurotransmitter:Na+ symporter
MSGQEASGWGSRVGLVLAMAGNAVGLGNFIRFPIQAIQNGGGAFIIPYLVCFLLMGIPLLFVEWSIGRFGGNKGNHSTPFILHEMDKRALWKYIGVFGIFTNLVVAAYYCYLESWTLSYMWQSIIGTFDGQTQDQVASFFGEYTSLNSIMPILFWVLCLFMNTWILSRGLSGGVEKASKIGMPLLILFGVFLAYKAITIEKGHLGAIEDGFKGLEFLWEPKFDSIWNTKVWLAAAGQIFFTLSIGMGSIQCYASYVGKKDDIALNAMSAGWMNGFVEIVLGSAILIPISIGYLGIEGVQELVREGGGFGLGFQTLPYLFEQWGSVMSVIAGIAWFGLLFFAGITSSLAMGTPVMAFLRDEFNWKESNAAWMFGGLVLILGLPTVLFYNYGVFDEFDYWAGTVSLVVFAFAEIILFAWVFGMDKGWAEINMGAEIKVPKAYKFIIKYVTPLILGAILINSLPDIWENLSNKKSKEKIAYYQDKSRITRLHHEQEGIMMNKYGSVIQRLDSNKVHLYEITTLKMEQKDSIKSFIENRKLKKDETYRLEKLDHEHKSVLYKNISRVMLLLLWLTIAYGVYIAYKKRKTA